jgi:cytoskeleton protein RodZ
MGSFGERMRRERDKRGITLDSISQTTKIGTHILEALEKEEFDKLPGGIFNKGFVRSYACFLGMNEEEVLEEFIEVAGDPEQPLPDPPAPRCPEIPQAKERRPWGGIAIVVVCAVAFLFGGRKVARMARRAAGATWSNASSSSSQGNEQSSGVPATDQPEYVATAMLQPASQTTTTSAPAPVPAAAPTRSEKFLVLVRAHKPTWVSITADGKPFLEGVLKRKKKIHAYSQVVLKTNNAGALAVSQNGKPLPPLGDRDQQITVTFTPDGVTR